MDWIKVKCEVQIENVRQLPTMGYVTTSVIEYIEIDRGI